MPEKFIKLIETGIFKSRYNQWLLIDTRGRERERLLVEDSGAEVLRFLFQGQSLSHTCRKFGLSKNELRNFLEILIIEKVIEYINQPYDSISRCFDVHPPLDSVNILITNACNLYCDHCLIDGGKPMDDELDGKMWINVLKQAQQLGAFRINVTGGEPLLHKDFFKIAEHIASVPFFNANLNTNGTLIKKGQEELLAKAFTSVQISLDDVVAEKHDMFRRKKGCFGKSIQAIEWLVAYGMEVNVGFSLTQHNFSAIDGIIDLCESLGVYALGIGLTANIGRAHKNKLMMVTDSQFTQDGGFFDKMYHKLTELSKRNTKLKILLPFRFHPDKKASGQKKNYICDGDNKQTLFIMANGAMMPCDKLPIQIFNKGNVREVSLVNAWTSDKMMAFKLMSPRQLPECRYCPHLEICGGACVARAFWTGGSLESPDLTSCIMAKKFATDKLA